MAITATFALVPNIDCINLVRNLRLDVSDNLLDAELASVVQGVTRMRSLLRCSLW